MAKCNSCSAPLPANSNRCLYCRVRNDVDLNHKYDYASSAQESQRICPICETHLSTINLGQNKALYIERCQSCYGLFFDPGELEALIEQSVSSVFTINKEQLDNINQDRYQKEKKVQYKRCPDCQDFMQRKNFAYKSGIIIDRCQKHGIWLDSGEISHLLEWRKAGGQLLDDKVKQRTTKDKTKSSFQSILNPSPTRSQSNTSNNFLEQDLIEGISHFISKIF